VDSIETVRLSAVALTLIAFVYIGWTYKTNDAAVFHTANRATTSAQTIASLFTVVGAPHFAIFTTLAYIFGWWATAFYAGCLFGFIIFGILAKRIRYLGAARSHTFTDIASREVGPRASASLFLLGFAYTLGVVVAQITIGAELLSQFVGVPYWICTLLIVLTVAAYLIGGGYRALVNTDIVQGIIMFVFTGILLHFLLTPLPASALNSSVILSRGGSSLMPIIPLLFLAGMLAICGSPEIWQRALNAKSDRTARRSLFTAGLTMLAWGVMVVGIGIAISIQNPTAEVGNAFVKFLVSGPPPYIIGLICVLIIAAIMSTADTELFTATILLRTEYRRQFHTINPEHLDVKTSRLIIFALASVVCIGALFLRDLQILWGVLLNLIYITAPLTLAIVLNRGGRGKYREAVFLFSAGTSISLFIFVGVVIGDYFSWWACAIILSASIPLMLPGKERSSVL